MSHAIEREFLDLDTYLVGERDAAFRSEYVDRQAYAMVGSNELHNTVAGELFAAIHHVLPNDCRVWQSDMKVKIEHGTKQFVYYPDIIAACGENPDDAYFR